MSPFLANSNVQNSILGLMCDCLTAMQEGAQARGSHSRQLMDRRSPVAIRGNMEKHFKSCEMVNSIKLI